MYVLHGYGCVISNSLFRCLFVSMKLKLEEEKAALFGLYVVFLFYGAYIHNSVKNLKTKIQYEVLELIF
jgi:hypothetical protein